MIGLEFIFEYLTFFEFEVFDIFRVKPEMFIVEFGVFDILRVEFEVFHIFTIELINMG